VEAKAGTYPIKVRVHDVLHVDSQPGNLLVEDALDLSPLVWDDAEAGDGQSTRSQQTLLLYMTNEHTTSISDHR
jgi:thiamine kinase-like enzyme